MTIWYGIQASGKQSIAWDPEMQPAGIYFYQLTIDKQSFTGKLVHK
jgi:hypothetical protein